MGIASTARRFVHWFMHPESGIKAVNCAASVEQAAGRLEQQAKQLKKALKDSGRQRRDMLGVALDDLRGRAASPKKPRLIPTEIPPPPKFTPAAATVEPRAKPTKPRRKRRG